MSASAALKNTVDHDSPQRPWLGAALLCTALFLFALQDVLVKDVTARVPVFEVLTQRIAIVAALFLVLCRWRGYSDQMRARQRLILMLRGVLAFFAFTAYYMALSRLPMATTSAVYMCAPLLVTAWSVPLLGEKVGVRRWLGVAAGFVGVLIIINPGSAMFQAAVLLPLFSAVCYSLIPIITRFNSRATAGLVMATYSSVAYLLCCLVLTVFVFILPASPESGVVWRAIAAPWIVPLGRDGAQILLAGLIFTAAMLAIAEAYRQAPVSVVAPFEYSYLLWSVLLGYLAFGDVPGVRVLAGAAIVIGSGLYVLHRDQRQSAVPATDR